jgi:hypothetical protein
MGQISSRGRRRIWLLAQRRCGEWRGPKPGSTLLTSTPGRDGEEGLEVGVRGGDGDALVTVGADSEASPELGSGRYDLYPILEILLGSSRGGTWGLGCLTVMGGLGIL